MALQDEQQIRTASSDNHSLVTVNMHSDGLPRSSLQPTALDVAALQEKDPIKRQEEFKMLVLKKPKCGPAWSGLEEQGGQAGSPGGAQSSSTPTVSSHRHKALGSLCFSHLRRQRVSTVYYGSFISICLCLQMPMLAAEPLQSQELCKLVTDNLCRKIDLSCSLLDTQNVENLQIMCFQNQSFQCHQYEGGRDRPEEAMKKSAGGPLRKAKSMTCKGTMTLKFLDDGTLYNCTFKNVNCSSKEQKMEDAESINMTIIIVSAVTAVIVLPILLIFIGLYIKREELQNWWKNRSSKSQPSPYHHTRQDIQPPYIPSPNTDPEDDDLHSVTTDGNAYIAIATADTHDAVPGETTVNPTEDPYPSGATVDTFLTADSESTNACDSGPRLHLPRCRSQWLCCSCLPGCRRQERPPVQIRLSEAGGNAGVCREPAGIQP